MPLPHTTRHALGWAATALLVAVAPLGAQRRVLRLGGDSAAAARASLVDADALLARGDSAGALKALGGALLLRPGDARAWHQRGMLAWAMAGVGPRYQRIDDVARDATRELLEEAGVALRRATGLAPDSARYAFDLGRFYLAGPSFRDERHVVLTSFDRALSATRRLRGAGAFAELADSMATLLWMRYDRVASRDLAQTGRYVALRGEIADTVTVDTENFRVPRTPPGWAGQVDYMLAEELLRAAAAADSANARVRGHLLRHLVERERWTDLRTEARRQQRVAPADSRGWLAEGLAEHRGDGEGAAAAFERALRLAGPADSARLASMTRVLAPADARRVAAMAPAERAAFETLAWRLIDPLWSTPRNELRVEFLARVAFAELRWTAGHAGAPGGADTDPGLVLVRAGPPAAVVSFAPDQRGFVQKRWRFADGQTVVFRAPDDGGAPTLPDSPLSARWRTERAASWHNVILARTLDTLPALAARFRSGGDSADVYLAGRVPVARLVGGMELARTPLQVELWVTTPRGEQVWRDSSRIMVAADAEPVQTRVWRRRMPAGAYMYRVEALQPELQRGARGGAAVSTPAGVSFALRGFGVSDLLVAERVQRRTEPPARWTDYNIVPNAGMLAHGQTFALLWESYELAATPEGTNRYRVELAVLPTSRRAPDAFTMRVRSGGADIGVAARTRDRLAFGFTRELPARAVHVNDVQLDLGRTDPGTYLLRVTLTDLVANRSDTRETVVTIAR